MSQETSKVCTKCGVEKPLEEFNRHVKGKFGHAQQCKMCTRKANREYVQKCARSKKPQLTEKYCPGCKTTLPATEFYKTRLSPTGLQPYCKSCKRLKDKQYHSRPEIKAKARERSRRQRKTLQFKRTAAIRRQRPENKIKRRARKVIEYQVRLGVIPNPKELLCVHCGQPAQEYHHRSYDEKRWLDVIPLCIPCHKAEHQRDDELEQATG